LKNGDGDGLVPWPFNETPADELRQASFAQI
jgi:hypothetical protein